MKSAKPLIQLTAYYLGFFALGYLLLYAFPGLSEYTPIGGTASLSSGIGEFISGKAEPIAIDSLRQVISLGIGLVCVLLLMEPVAWIYMGARRRKGRDQSFIITVLLLPVVVAGIVIIVQNSLALAFSLAGIVAAVRFRLTLDDTLDAIFIFLAIGVGLAAGINALEIAAVITIFFNFSMLFFWELDYGDEVSVNRWFTKTWMHNEIIDFEPVRTDSIPGDPPTATVNSKPDVNRASSEP